jgi:outer membrane protein
MSAALTAYAQTPLTLEQAVRQAADRYPAVTVSTERANAAAAAIRLARVSYLPQVNAIAQVNRATTNNLYGMLLQQSVISPISGPPVLKNRATNVFGTAVGALATWEPFDFGLRRATVDAASAASRRAQASTETTRFETTVSVVDAFLTVLAAEQQLQAAEASVTRARVLHERIRALSVSGLRPGADEARARAELAVAETQRIQALQAVRIAKVSLAEFLGVGENLTLAPGALLNKAPSDAATAANPHPAEKEQTVAIEEVQSRERVLDKSFVPKFSLEGTTYARGTGARPDFSVLGGANGLAPTYFNWGIGFSVTMSLTDYKSLAERKRIEAANENAERARLDLVRRNLSAQLLRAQAALEGAELIAKNTPIQLEAARSAQQQATARYRSGLGPVTDVADAQRLLTSTEIDDALAKLSVWRGLLAVAAARGDIEGFLQAAR